MSLLLICSRMCNGCNSSSVCGGSGVSSVYSIEHRVCSAVVAKCRVCILVTEYNVCSVVAIV